MTSLSYKGHTGTSAPREPSKPLLFRRPWLLGSLDWVFNGLLPVEGCVGGWRGRSSKSAPKKEKQSWGCRPCYTGLRLLGGLSGIWGGLKPVPGASPIQHRHEGPPNLHKEPPFQGYVAASANVNCLNTDSWSLLQSQPPCLQH